MKVKILKVISQSEPVYVQSKKSETGQVAKSMIRLKELGGEYEDEFVCSLFGDLALQKWLSGKMVVASLRFQAHEANGIFYQDVIANDIQALN